MTQKTTNKHFLNNSMLAQWVYLDLKIVLIFGYAFQVLLPKLGED